MDLKDLISDWLSKEFPELEVNVISDTVGEIIKRFPKRRLVHMIAYITDHEVLFGPDWNYATTISAADPEFFYKMRLLIDNSNWKNIDLLRATGVRTMM